MTTSGWLTRVRATAALLLLAACARPRAADSAARTPVDRETVVLVENRNWTDVVISLSRGGRLTRIGTVLASSEAALRFPTSWALGSSELQLAARAIGGRGTVRSEIFVLLPGQRVEWTLENKLTRASLAIY